MPKPEKIIPVEEKQGLKFEPVNNTANRLIEPIDAKRLQVLERTTRAAYKIGLGAAVVLAAAGLAMPAAFHDSLLLTYAGLSACGFLAFAAARFCNNLKPYL